MLDISDTIVPRSDQLNADDLIAGPRRLVITGVKKAPPPQSLEIRYEGDGGRPYKPCLTMRRVLIRAWGCDGEVFIGRTIQVYLDPSVKMKSQEVGGIRISHLSHIDHEIRMALTVSRGKKGGFVVRPLQDADSEEAEDREAYQRVVDRAFARMVRAVGMEEATMRRKQAWASSGGSVADYAAGMEEEANEIEPKEATCNKEPEETV